MEADITNACMLYEDEKTICIDPSLPAFQLIGKNTLCSFSEQLEIIIVEKISTTLPNLFLGPAGQLLQRESENLFRLE